MQLKEGLEAMKINRKDLLENYNKLSEEVSRGMSRDKQIYNELHAKYLDAIQPKVKKKIIRNKSPRV